MEAGIGATARPPLEIVLLVEGLDAITPWQWRLLARLAADDRFALVGRINAKAPAQARSLSWIAATILAADSRFLARTKEFDVLPIRSRIEKLPILSAPDRSCGRAQCDVVLRLGGTQLDCDDLSVARIGECSLSFCDSRDPSADWTAFAEVLRGEPTITVDVCARSTGTPQRTVVSTADYNPKISSARTAAFIHEKSVILLQRTLVRIAETRCFGNSGAALPAPPAAPSPSPRAALAYGVRLCGKLGARATERLSDRIRQTAPHWELRFGVGEIASLNPACSATVTRTETNMADPFLFEHNGRLYVFYEADDGDGGPAWISVGLFENGGFRRLGIALKLDHHLSYPYMFRHRGSIFMMPESQQRKRLEIWRSTDFPFGWELHAVALEGMLAADTNYFDADGTRWLMTNLSDHHTFQEHSSELYLFEVDGPDLRRVEPHRCNPVVIGSSVARNAGPVVAAGGRLYRPSQINAFATYGYGLNINVIERLDRRDYREKAVRSITPDFAASVDGVHHVSFGAGHFVIDVRRRSPGVPPAH